jgi:hypothetical protein
MESFKSADEALNFLNEEKERKQKEFENSKNPKNYRFFMKKGTETSVVFIDDLLFVVNEHRFKKDGHYNNFETCVKDVEGECLICDADNRPYIAWVTTVIDLTPYTKKDGTEVTVSKKLMVVKQGGAEKLLRRQKKMGTLKGKKFTLSRSSDPKGEATGTDIEFDKDVDLDQLKQFAPEGIDQDEWITPFDYKELFKPKSIKELRQEMGISPPVGSDDDHFEQQAPAQKKSIQDLV